MGCTLACARPPLPACAHARAQSLLETKLAEEPCSPTSGHAPPPLQWRRHITPHHASRESHHTTRKLAAPRPRPWPCPPPASLPTTQGPTSTHSPPASPLRRRSHGLAAHDASTPLDCLDVPPVGGDMSVCAAAWRTHMVVLSAPWEDSSVNVLAVYECQDVGVGEGGGEEGGKRGGKGWKGNQAAI